MVRTLRIAAVPLAAVLAGGGCSSTAFEADFGDCTPVGAYTQGTTVTGTLTASDCQIPADGTRADVYTLTVTEQRSLSITLRSLEFDAFLALLDADGALLRADDDGAAGTGAGQSPTDARLDLFSLEPGEYRLVVNTAAEDDGGAYTLSSTQ